MSYKSFKSSAKVIASHTSKLELGRHHFNRENVAYVTLHTPLEGAVMASISIRMATAIRAIDPSIPVSVGHDY